MAQYLLLLTAVVQIGISRIRYLLTFGVSSGPQSTEKTSFKLKPYDPPAQPYCFSMGLAQKRFAALSRRDTIRVMKTDASKALKDGVQCKVIGGTHEGKSGTVTDIKTGRTGHVSITVVQSTGVRLKTLAKNVTVL